jgi:periplasmic divalent cation tolerance protein
VLWFVNKKAQYGVNMGLYILCLVTIDDLAKASEIAAALVEKRLAACVNIVPEIQSIYRWKGQMCNDTERLLIIKTQKHLFDRLEAVVKEMHPYETPEIISFDIQQGYPGYLRWIDDSTEPPA